MSGVVGVDSDDVRGNSLASLGVIRDQAAARNDAAPGKALGKETNHEAR